MNMGLDTHTHTKLHLYKNKTV